LIASQHPNSTFADEARLGIARTETVLLILFGKTQEAQAAVEKLKTDFAGHPELADTLYEIAVVYDYVNSLEEAIELHSSVATDYADKESGSKSSIQESRLAIFELIDANELEAAEAAVVQMEADFAGHEMLCEQLELIAERYDKAGQFPKARAIYEQIINNCPENEISAIRADARLEKHEIFSAIESINDANCHAVIEKIKNEIPDVNECSHMLYYVAERLYNKGIILFRKDRTKAADYFAISTELLENEVADYIDNRDMEADTYLRLLIMYNLTGNYLESMYCCDKHLNEYPYFPMEWYVLFVNGRNYENLKLNGLINKVAADELIESTYQKLVAEYPNCDPVCLKHAKNWLNRYGQNIDIEPFVK
jgi:tetratricopeptide (TPR) repeat protein